MGRDKFSNFVSHMHMRHMQETPKETNYKEEVVILDKSDESELTDEINNARKKRRRSSATIK